MSKDFECRACAARQARDGADAAPAGGPLTGPIPFQSPLRDEIAAGVCDVCWQDWLQMQIKIINELALNLGDSRSHEILEAHARDYLGLSEGNESGTDFAAIGAEPPASPTS
jgi:Fe-S cluster biosynthesis and repair protein YggX